MDLTCLSVALRSGESGGRLLEHLELIVVSLKPSMRGWTRLQECFEPRFPSRTSPRASLPSYCFSRYAHTPGHVRRKDSSELHPLLRGPLLVFTCPPRGHNVLADGCIILIKFDISCNASRFHLKSVFICCYLVLTDLK